MLDLFRNSLQTKSAIYLYLDNGQFCLQACTKPVKDQFAKSDKFRKPAFLAKLCCPPLEFFNGCIRFETRGGNGNQSLSRNTTTLFYFHPSTTTFRNGGKALKNVLENLHTPIKN